MILKNELKIAEKVYGIRVCALNSSQLYFLFDDSQNLKNYYLENISKSNFSHKFENKIQLNRNIFSDYFVSFLQILIINILFF